MKNIPLLKSKLTIPELPEKALLSERIKSLPIAKKRAAIITAPGGFGKTTAVLLALKKERAHINWYRLEKEDSFLPVFYTHLLEALFPGIDKTTLDCQRGISSVNNIYEDYVLLNALICQDAWQHITDKQPYRYLVLDDYQNVSDNARISESIRYFIDNLPPGIGIIVISREEAGILSGSLALNRDISLISSDDLRFTRLETEKLLLGRYNIELSVAELDRIHEYLEGWIAGLCLVSRIDTSLLFSLAAGKGAEKIPEESLFSHFFNEYLQGVEEDRLRQLAAISILFDFSCDDLKEILQIKDAQKLVKWLEKSNMYIQRIKTQPVKYRFHSLFRRELNLYFKRNNNEEYIKELYAKAATYYNEVGDFQLAICYYLAAGQTDAAINIISVNGAKLFAAGQPEKIMYLITEFPETVIRNDPYLLFYRGLIMLTSDIDEAYNCFKTAFLKFDSRNDMSYLMNAFGMILVLSFQTNDFKYANDIATHLPKFKVALSSSSPRKKLFLSAFISFVAEENFKAAMLLYRSMARINAPEPIWDYSYLVIRGMLLYRTGQLKAAYKNLPKILNHPVGLASDQWRAIGLIGCHNTLWLSRDIVAAKKTMDEFAELGEKYDSDFYRSFAHRLSAIINFQTRNISTAMADMEEVANCYTRYGSPTLASAAMITKYLWETELSPEQTLLEKAEEEFTNISKDDAGHGYYELCQGMMGAIYKACGDFEKSESFLLSAYNVSRKKKAHQHMCAIAMHLADLYYQTNKPKLSAKYLTLWAKQSKEKNYFYFHEMDYPTLVRACALAMEKGLCQGYIRKTIRLYFGQENEQRLAEKPSLAAASPEEFIAGCMPLAKKEQTIRITFFGKFTIQQGEVLIEEKDWKTRKVSGILKYILATPDERVTRDALAAAFWPNSDAKAASTSLRVALYELRKTLSRFGMGFKGENALLAEDLCGFYIADGNIVKSDAQEFSELYKAYISKEVPEEQAEKALKQLTDLYTGDFLADSPYEEWSFFPREHYKAIFIEASQALSQIYIRNGRLKEAEKQLEKHLTIDPFDEKACAFLVDVYKKTKQTVRANSFLRQFNKRLRAEMDIDS